MPKQKHSKTRSKMHEKKETERRLKTDENAVHYHNDSDTVRLCKQAEPHDAHPPEYGHRSRL